MQMQSLLRVSPDEHHEQPDYRAETVRHAWEISGVPHRYRNVPASEGKVSWTYITGPVGAGKTYGACSMLRKFIEDETRELAPDFFAAPKAHFTTAARYLQAVKDAWERPEDWRARVWRRSDLLVLDDLGQENPTSWACEQIFDLVNERYNDDLPTIVTSQFGLDGIAGRLGANGGKEQAEAIASRLAGCCKAYRLACGDRRHG